MPGALRKTIGELEPWVLELLRLLAEQGAIPFDQLARFCRCEPEQATRLAKYLTRQGLTDYGRSLFAEPHWLWLTYRGARHSGTGFSPNAPRVGAIARMRALNEVRLHITERAPEARWISGRSVFREQGMRGHRPNAVVEIGAERHAILIRSGQPKPPEREIPTLETHLRRYDALICFANRRSLPSLRRLKTDHRWPKLVLREIPTPPNRAASPRPAPPPDQDRLAVGCRARPDMCGSGRAESAPETVLRLGG